MHGRTRPATNFVIRALLAAVIAAFGISLSLVGPASAAAPAAPAVVAGAPSGCPSGAVCFYRQGNGGQLCGVWYNSASDLGSCANIGPSGSIFNNGTSCSGCQDVNLYYNTGYGGAYYCLPKGHYLLYIEQNYFNRGSGAGYGQTLAFRPGQVNGPGGVASVKWTSC